MRLNRWLSLRSLSQIYLIDSHLKVDFINSIISSFNLNERAEINSEKSCSNSEIIPTATMMNWIQTGNYSHSPDKQNRRKIQKIGGQGRPEKVDVHVPNRVWGFGGVGARLGCRPTPLSLRQLASYIVIYGE